MNHDSGRCYPIHQPLAGDTSEESMQLRISVVIPTYNGGKELASVLQSLSLSTYPAFECIVVDDCSTDGSVRVAVDHGCAVVRLQKRVGPAAARNRGASLATGDILLFLDADVCVHSDTLDRIACAFRTDPSIAALIGSYDDDPQATDFLSQYRNLMHHYVHQSGLESASTFWSGCGAIRRSVFHGISGFDESYSRPAIEDIELGYRLLQSGKKVLLDHDLTVKHLKHWTFWGLVRTDICDRGIPWTELILRDRHMPNDLNLQLSQRVSVALAFLLVIMAAAAAIWWRGYFLTPLFALVFFMLARFWVEAAAESRPKAAPLWLMGAMLAIIAMAALHNMFWLIPPLVLSQLLLFSRHRYARASPRNRKWLRVPAVLYVLFSALSCLYYLPSHVVTLSGFLLAVLLGLLNSHFYLFLAAKRGLLFAVAAIPFHMLYHFYNGISFLIGTLRYQFGPRNPGRVAGQIVRSLK
jgi:glycosyltransferase involved in cell wall biosynthesis